MGQLLDLLQAAAGEASLHGMLGRWRQRVSEVVDAIGDVDTSQITSQISQLVTVVTELARHSDREFVRAPLAGTVVTAAFPDVIDMAELDSNGNISYDSATGVYTLDPNHTYHLLAHGTVLFGAPTDSVQIDWVDASTNAPLPVEGPGRYLPTTFAGSDRTFNPVVEAFLVSGSATTQVKLRASAFVGASATLADDFVTSIVEIR